MYLIINCNDNSVLGTVNNTEEASKIVDKLNINAVNHAWCYTSISPVTMEEVEAIIVLQESEFQDWCKAQAELYEE